MTDTPTVSRNCSIGNHKRCLGTVLVYPPVDGERIIPCQCDAADCNHPVRRVAAVQAEAAS